MATETNSQGSRSPEDLRKFGLIMGALVAIFFGLLVPWLWSTSFGAYPWLVAGAFAGLALVYPRSLSPVFVGWMWIGEKIGRVNQFLLLSIVFYVIFTPIGVVLRLLGKDLINRRVDKDAATYRIASEQPGAERLRAPY